MKFTNNPLIIFLLIMALAISGCAVRNATDTRIFRDISTQEAAELIKDNESNPDFTMLDVRTPGEFKAGHIEGAINLDFYSASFSDELAKLNRENTYFVYCSSGNRSGQAMKMMGSLGFNEVYNLSGGMSDWIADGFPVAE
ncbi:rhodanese-like domain-containing protein [Chloroflexota bacterium]